MCSNHAGQVGGASVWWTWTAPHSGAVVVNAVGDTFIPRAAVYTGATLTSLQQVAAGFSGGSGLNTILNFSVTAGTAYQIALEGFFGSGSRFYRVHLEPLVGPVLSGRA